MIQQLFHLMNTENLRLCDRRNPFLLRLWLEEMDGCNMAVVFRNLNGHNSTQWSLLPFD